MFKTIFIQGMLLLSFIYFLYKNDKIDLKEHKVILISVVYLILSTLFYSSSNIQTHANIKTNMIKAIVYYAGFIVIAIILIKDKLKALYISLVFALMINVIEYFILYLKLWYIPYDYLYILYPVLTIGICCFPVFKYSKRTLLWNVLMNIMWMIVILNNQYYLFLMMETIAPLYVFIFFIIWIIGNYAIEKTI